MTSLTGYRGAVMTPRAGTRELDYHDDTVLTVAPGGTIVGLYKPGDAPPELRLIHDLRGSLIVPGFVDTHLHYPQTRVTGSASGPLLEWLERTVFPEEARFSNATYAADVAREFTMACARHGTTTVGAYSSSSATATTTLFRCLEDSGLRAVVGLVLMDQNCPDALRVPADRALSEADELAATWHGRDAGRLSFAVTPRFAITCSKTMLAGAAALSERRSLLVMTHVAENPKEENETLEVHPWATDYLDVYERVGLVHERTILAHAIHFDGAQWDRVGARRAKIAHCPDSNFFLGSGMMRLAEPRSRGVVVGLGTDVAAGRSFDIRRTLSHAYDASLMTAGGATAEELFELATLGGARVLGKDDVVGSLEAGKEADFVVLQRPAHAEGKEGALRIATFGSEAGPVTRTYVRGKLVWSRAAD
ncbi:MAG: guanine deaminase [Polyangiaceae bacterium]|nr:guanine deaminase [Polyangiaceae bacterium]